MAGTKVDISADVVITKKDGKEIITPVKGEGIVGSPLPKHLRGKGSRLIMVGFLFRWKTSILHVRDLFLADVEKKRTKDQVPAVYTKMPCGKEYVYYYHEFPFVDTPCECGNPNHWVVKYERFPGTNAHTAGDGPASVFPPTGRHQKGEEKIESGIIPEGDVPEVEGIGV